MFQGNLLKILILSFTVAACSSKEPQVKTSLQDQEFQTQSQSLQVCDFEQIPTDNKSLSVNGVNEALNSLLESYAGDTTSFVDYEGWLAHNNSVLGKLNEEVSAEQVEQSRRDLASLCGLVDYFKQEQNFSSELEAAAYYINAYNTAMFLFVLNNFEAFNAPDEGPTAELRDRSLAHWKNRNGIAFRFVDDVVFTVNGATRSFNDLELEVIKRVGFAGILVLNRASADAPPLVTEAYTAENIEAHLKEVSEGFVNEQFLFEFIPDENIVDTTFWPMIYERKIVFEAGLDKKYPSFREFIAAHVIADEVGVSAEELLAKEVTESGEIQYVWSIDYESWTAFDIDNNGAFLWVLNGQ